jgi:hypothetical protein
LAGCDKSRFTRRDNPDRACFYRRHSRRPQSTSPFVRSSRGRKGADAQGRPSSRQPSLGGRPSLAEPSRPLPLCPEPPASRSTRHRGPALPPPSGFIYRQRQRIGAPSAGDRATIS